MKSKSLMLSIAVALIISSLFILNSCSKETSSESSQSSESQIVSENTKVAESENDIEYLTLEDIVSEDIYNRSLLKEGEENYLAFLDKMADLSYIKENKDASHSFGYNHSVQYGPGNPFKIEIASGTSGVFHIAAGGDTDNNYIAIDPDTGDKVDLEAVIKGTY